MFQDAPRIALLGAMSGSLDQGTAMPVLAWAHLEPAYVGAEVGEGLLVNQRTDSAGRTSTSSSESFCAPLVPSPGWRGPVSFVVCESERSALPRCLGLGSSRAGSPALTPPTIGPSRRSQVRG